MKTLRTRLIKRFQDATLKAFPSQPPDSLFPCIDVTQATQEHFGHYQCNAAMKLAKLVQKNPRAVAQELIDALDKEDGLFQKTEIAGPGFINIAVSPESLSEGVASILSDASAGIDRPSSPQRVVVDFSSPNIAKEMHVGHLRSTIIGDCLARLFEFLGHDVLRINHLGDWGTQFGMLIAYMKESASEVLRGEVATDLTHLVTWYKASKARFDADAEFKKTAQREVVALQGGDPDSLRAWRLICAISERAYQEIYDLLEVQLIDRGESFYNPLLPGLVKDLEERGLVVVSEGAKCVFVEGFTNREGQPLPLMVQKADGGYSYDTTDLAAIRHRVEVEKANRLIYVTDAGQGQHFQMVFKAAEKAGYLDPRRVRADHVPFGLVLGPDGKKFRTRSGETEKLIDLLKAAVDQAKKILAERDIDFTEEERNALAKALGIGAIKYADLSSNRVSDYVFSYDRMLRFEGNTAAFLMYSYVRINGIKRKVGVEPQDLLDKETPVVLTHPSEIALALQLVRFGEALQQVAEDLLPNRLTDYLYDLSQKFNLFFRDCRVEGSPEQNSRLLLCEATARTLRAGFSILGLKTVERM